MSETHEVRVVGRFTDPAQVVNEKYIATLKAALSDAQAKLAASESGSAAMREALIEVQWAEWDGADNHWVCPDCKRPKKSGHEHDCYVGKALATPSGTALLRRVEAGERLFEAAVKIRLSGDEPMIDDVMAYLSDMRFALAAYESAAKGDGK